MAPGRETRVATLSPVLQYDDRRRTTRTTVNNNTANKRRVSVRSRSSSVVDTVSVSGGDRGIYRFSDVAAAANGRSRARRSSTRSVARTGESVHGTDRGGSAVRIDNASSRCDERSAIVNAARRGGRRNAHAARRSAYFVSYGDRSAASCQDHERPTGFGAERDRR